MTNYCVTAANLNVCEGPSITAKVKSALPHGVVVDILDVSGNRWPVQEP